MRNILHSLFFALSLGYVAVKAEPPRLINDTGQTLCIVSMTATSECSRTRQDANLGRDIIANSNVDGRLGFSFVKVDESGNDLPADAANWACVRDRVTKLMWEVKTKDGGLRDRNKRYTYYDNARKGSAKAFADQVNAQGLCGYHDWRVPEPSELFGIVDIGKSAAPYIDEKYFPNTLPKQYRAARAFEGGSDAFKVFFSDFLGLTISDRSALIPARLVRGERLPQTRFIANGGEVQDALTGLIWRRCMEGQTWNGSACVGDGIGFSFSEAIKRAREESSSSGLEWRLPNIKELDSIYDNSSSGLDPVLFPGISTYYWSSTFARFIPELDLHLQRTVYVRAARYIFDRNDTSPGGNAVRLVREE